ncbi:MAG: PhoH family protein, partial [Candidatus Delongbacteria bacterium]|nr:PhoH family protein [Candidatus Delongbacteria bacterium]
LLYIQNKQAITKTEVFYAIDRAENEEKIELKHLFSDELTMESLKTRIKPKTEGQGQYIEAMINHDITFVIGPAGTGKTYLAVAMAVALFKKQRIERIVLTRPAVEAGESLGFLPGDLKEKVDPYLRPLYDALFDMMPFERVRRCMETNVIEVVPLAFMRGRTLNNAFIILDEAQNTTNLQMKMFLTRMGYNSKAVITGDITQIDLAKEKKSGLILVQEILKDVQGINFTFLNEMDVVRHRLIKKIIKAYDVYEKKHQEL